MNSYQLLERKIISVSGLEAKDFLQALITNDINKVSSTNSIYACLLNPQGKYNYDFFISYWNDQYLIDIDSNKAEECVKKLNLYKLRKIIDIVIEPLLRVIGFFNEDSNEISPLGLTSTFLRGIKYTDPRSRGMGNRIILPNENIEIFKNTHNLAEENYNYFRINNTIAEGEYDLIFDKSFPLEFGLDKFNAFDFDKGCYIGQEVTARTKYRGVIRKKLYKIVSDFSLPNDGEIFYGEKKIGSLTSSYKSIGLALIREEEYILAKQTSIENHALINNIKVHLID